MWVNLENEKWAEAGRILNRPLLETNISWPLKRLPAMATRRHACFYWTLVEKISLLGSGNTDAF